MRAGTVIAVFVSVTLLGVAAKVRAQTLEPDTRQAVIEREQADRVDTLHPYVLTRGERLVTKLQERFVNQQTNWHPFFENAYSGGGFAAGLGYMHHVSTYNVVDVRGSYSIRSYKRAEAEFVFSHLFQRRADLSVLGGWRDATEVAFHGVGQNTPSGALHYGFEQPHGSALLTLWPTRRLLMLQGGVELSKWTLKPSSGSSSIETLFSPATLAGVDTRTTYVHTQATMGADWRKSFDWRTSPGYARRGGFYGVTAHDFTDQDSRFGFRQVDYDAVQHVPILRETWVLSLHARAETTWEKGDQLVPFFMLPSLGGGSALRSYSSWRFRDRNSLLLQGEWRIIVNRGFETAFFYDAGKVAARRSDLDFDGMASSYGFGARFNALHATFLRVEVARGREGMRLVFATSSPF